MTKKAEGISHSLRSCEKGDKWFVFKFLNIFLKRELLVLLPIHIFYNFAPMARIMGIDYGTKRIGIAVTDPLQIIASPLETVENQKIMIFLANYFFTEEVECIIVGEPKKLDNSDAEIMPKIRDFINSLNKLFPNIPVNLQDERFTSTDAKRIILDSGISKMKRRDKSLVDKVSATIILKEWMENNGKWQRS